MARARWERSLAARKGAATRRRKQLAVVERAGASVQLQEAVAKVQGDLIEREAALVIDRTKKILEKPATNLAEQERRRRAIAGAEKEIQRLKEGNLSPAEQTEIKHKAQVNIQLGREMVEQAVVEFYEKAKAEGRIERISRHHKPGTIAKVSYRERHGVVADRRLGKLLSEATEEEILSQMMQAAEVVGKRQKGGKLYATFSYFEYGKDRPRSGYTIPAAKSGDPSAGILQDTFGYFYQSFDATNFLGGADTPDQLEIKLRAVLDRKLQESAGKNAAVLIGFQMKSYIERTEEEQKEFDRAMWRKLKRAQRKAEKAKAKGEAVQWIDPETLKK